MIGTYASFTMTRTRASFALTEITLVLAVWAVVMWGVGAKWWTGFNSPDSQFSASLAIFGNSVHDRAIDGSYYWTRLGYLAPVHGLIKMFGIWAGFAIWRGLLLLLIVGATYWLARRLTGRALSVALAFFVGLNTMVLSYLGNTYATGSAMAATFVVITLGSSRLRAVPGRGYHLAQPIFIGLVFGWLVMLNPYNAMLAVFLWLGIRIVAWWIDRVSALALMRELLWIVLGFVISFAAFLLLGRTMFPGLDWFGTYRSWNAKLDYASFISDPHIWTRDVAFLVLLLSVLVSVFGIVFVRNRWTTTALVLALSNIAFTLGYMQVIPGPWIEAPHYAAMCWPGALAAIVIAIAAVFGQRQVSLTGWLFIPFLIVFMVWAGNSDRIFDMSTGLSIVLLTSAVVFVTLMLCATRGSLVGWLAVMLALIVLGLASQFLQNGRGNLGIYGQYPMNAAYFDYQVEDLMRSNVAAQEYVLSHTSPTDRIATWTDPDRLTSTIAAMQLWGKYNNVAEGAVLSSDGANELQQLLRPSALALYAPSQSQIDAFFASIPAGFAPTPLECTTVPYLGIGSPTASVCVTHLRGL